MIELGSGLEVLHTLSSNASIMTIHDVMDKLKNQGYQASRYWLKCASGKDGTPDDLNNTPNLKIQEKPDTSVDTS